MNWIVFFIIAFGIGCVAGLIVGLMVADNYWKTKMCPYCDHDYEKYLKKKSFKQSERTDINHD